MNLIFSSFADVGDLTKERLILKAVSDIPLGDYAVFLSKTSPDGTAYSGQQTAFWFPDGDIKANDLAVLYTKSGVASKKVLDSGATAHFFYWGLTAAQWGRTSGKGAVILRAAEWKFHSSAK